VASGVDGINPVASPGGIECRHRWRIVEAKLAQLDDVREVALHEPRVHGQGSSPYEEAAGLLPPRRASGCRDLAGEPGQIVLVGPLVELALVDGVGLEIRPRIMRLAASAAYPTVRYATVGAD
jgi:hypothetical protein